MIDDLQLRPWRVPFRQAFTHASARRRTAESVIATARSRTGLTGFGEGCPREYVTGESVESCLDWFARHRSGLVGVADLGALTAWAAEHRQTIDDHPAAWCAVELAALDLFAREAGMSVEAMLGLPPIGGEFRYTAVLGAEGARTFGGQLRRYTEIGFRDFKIKLTGEEDDERLRLDQVLAAGEAIGAVRFDANNLWKTPEEAISYLRRTRVPFWAVEEPVTAGDFASLGRVARELGARVIVDESFRGLRDLASLEGGGARWIINLRVSKMGGLLRSLEIARAAVESGIPLIIGCQVGESSVLTRAALTVANTFRNSVRAMEGAFGTLLLEEDIVSPPIQFGRGGLLSPASHFDPAAPGFGLPIAPAAIAGEPPPPRELDSA